MGGMRIHCPHDSLVSVTELKPHPKNRNAHPRDQIKRLAKILEYQGWRYPIKVSKLSGYITSGHGRLEAAKLLKLKEVPVSFQDYSDEAQEYADLQSDNSIASWAELDLSGINADIVDLGPDFDLDLLGIKDFVLEPVEKLEPQCDEDEIPDALPEPKVVRGEVYILGKHRLMCGDSTAITDVERLMDGKKAHLIHTDPPYNIGSDSKNYVGEIRPDSYGELKEAEWDKNFPIEEALSCLCAVVQDSFTAYIWTSQFLINRIWQHFGAYDFTGYLVWNKSNPMPSLSKRHPTWNTELCVYVAHGSDRAVNFPTDGHFLSVRTLAQKTNGRVHPTQKPIELIEPLIEFSSAKNQNVVDLFGGSGSTLIACEKTGRQCFMMELDPHYCGVILERWQRFTGKKAHREDGVAWDEIKAGARDGQTA